MKKSSKVVFRKASSVALAAALMLGTTAAVPFTSNVFNGAAGITANAAGEVSSLSDLSNDSTLSSDTVTLGNYVSVNKAVSGNIGTVTYNIVARHEDDEEWVGINPGFFYPEKTGKYYVKITVTDNTGIIRGDANCDGQVTISDATAIQRKIAEMDVTLFNEAAADANGDGDVDIRDATAIQRYLAGYENVYNIGEEIQNSVTVIRELTVNPANPVEELVNKSDVTPKTVLLGKACNITPAAEGGVAPYTYKVLYKKTTDTNWVELKGTVFKPKKAVNYDICIKAYDSEGSCAKRYFVIKVIGMSVSINHVEDAKSDVPVIVAPKVPVTVKAASEGFNAPFTYAVFYKKATDTQWARVQDFDANDTVSFRPAKKVMYDVCVKTKDSKGNIVKEYFKVDIKNLVENTSTISAEEILKGEEVTVNCSAAKGTEPYTYQVLYKKSTDKQYAVVQDFSDNATVSFKPMKAPVYDVRVIAQDANGGQGIADFQVNVYDYQVR